MTPQERRSAWLRRAKAREGNAADTGDGLARRIEQHVGNEPRSDEQLRRGGGRKGAEQVIVLGTNGGTGITAGDLVSGLIHLLIGDLGGIKSMVGHQHALQTIKNE